MGLGFTNLEALYFQVDRALMLAILALTPKIPPLDYSALLFSERHRVNERHGYYTRNFITGYLQF